MKSSKKILVISEGPPPLGDTKAEGGALRAWGLSKGLALNGHVVTFAYRSTFDIAENALEKQLPKNIFLTTWNGDTIDRLLESHKIILMRYAMGEAAQITQRLTPEHILVSDSYIPISIEVSARNSSDKDELYNYLILQENCAKTAKRADYFLYASPSQKSYYVGYLSALNKINPITYKEIEDRIFEVPYGIDPSEKDHKALANKPKQPTLLWYGAFYSWFDMESLIESLIKIKKNKPDFKLLVAGAKNPYNKDVGILAHYEKTINSLAKLGDAVEFIDWRPYSERFEVYARASAIITYNHLGIENQYAWRTRLMDYVLSDRPILTNGGDPLGEDLIQRGIAFRAEPQNLSAAFESAIKNQPKKSLFDDAAERYSWINVTKQLADELTIATNMTPTETEYRIKPAYYIKSATKKIFRFPIYVIKNGPKKSIKRLAEVVGVKS